METTIRIGLGLHKKPNAAEIDATKVSSSLQSDSATADYFDRHRVDPQQAIDVARWRQAERRRLRSERDNLSVADRRKAGHAIRFKPMEPLDWAADGLP